MIDEALQGAREVGAALCAVPVSDTVKRADPTGKVSSTVTREGLWLA
jgi:2-C-methyl-D-erythritol 4-phosphate cytidylyltransferase/2-C-methyl-D-erythritol 2,4-cyclodiphosphate synthase